MKLRATIAAGLVVWALASGAQTTTPNVGLTKPSSGAANWHTPLNGNFDIIDNIFGGTVTVPAFKATKYQGGVHFLVIPCGAEGGATLTAATCSLNGAFFNHFGAGMTITEIFCQVDAGTPRVQVYRLSTNAGSTHDATTRIMTDNTNAGLDCSNAGTTGTLDGTTKAITDNYHLDFVLVDASTAKRLTLQIKYTMD